MLRPARCLGRALGAGPWAPGPAAATAAAAGSAESNLLTESDLPAGQVGSPGGGPAQWASESRRRYHVQVSLRHRPGSELTSASQAVRPEMLARLREVASLRQLRLKQCRRGQCPLAALCSDASAELSVRDQPPAGGGGGGGPTDNRRRAGPGGGGPLRRRGPAPPGCARSTSGGRRRQRRPVPAGGGRAGRRRAPAAPRARGGPPLFRRAAPLGGAAVPGEWRDEPPRRRLAARGRHAGLGAAAQVRRSGRPAPSFSAASRRW